MRRLSKSAKRVHTTNDPPYQFVQMRGPFLNGHAELALTKLAPAPQAPPPPSPTGCANDSLAMPASGDQPHGKKGSPELRHVLNLDPPGAAGDGMGAGPPTPDDGEASGEVAAASKNLRVRETGNSPKGAGSCRGTAGVSPIEAGNSPEEAGKSPDNDAAAVKAEPSPSGWDRLRRRSSSFISFKRPGRAAADRARLSTGNFRGSSSSSLGGGSDDGVLKEEATQGGGMDARDATELPRDKLRRRG